MSEGRGVFTTETIVDARQLSEIRLALYYNEHCNHGTDGHNRLNLLAMFARAQGLRLDADCKTLLVMYNPKSDFAMPDVDWVRPLDGEETLAWYLAHGEAEG